MAPLSDLIVRRSERIARMTVSTLVLAFLSKVKYLAFLESNHLPSSSSYLAHL